MKKETNELKEDLTKVQVELVNAATEKGALEQQKSHLEHESQALILEKVQLASALQAARDHFTTMTEDIAQRHESKVQQLSDQVERFHEEIERRDRASKKQKTIVQRMMEIE